MKSLFLRVFDTGCLLEFVLHWQRIIQVVQIYIKCDNKDNKTDIHPFLIACCLWKRLLEISVQKTTKKNILELL